MKVLVPIADDSITEVIVSFIENYNWPAHTEFKVLNVIEPPGSEHLSDVPFLPFLEGPVQDSRLVAQAMVRRAALKIRDKFRSPYVEEEVIEGKAREKILSASESWSADLIVIGSAGKSGFDRLMLGSVSSAVVSHALCSVIVVRPARQQLKKPIEQKVEDTRSQMLTRTAP